MHARNDDLWGWEIEQKNLTQTNKIKNQNPTNAI